jgi:hypothetical protein
MDFEKAERRFAALQALRKRGELRDDQFRLEVAKLLHRDARGVFWMIEAEDGTWYRNSGEGWIPGDPQSEQIAVAVPASKARSAWWVLAVAVPLLVILGLAVSSWFWQWPLALQSWLGLAPAANVQITIASPSDGTEVVRGQEVAIEATLFSSSGLQGVDRVELQADGRTVRSQPVWSQVEARQSTLPLSLPWLPTETGEHRIDVIALAADGERLGQANINLTVTEASAETLREPACTPDATYLADVTVPAGAIFPPGSTIEKVWQVRNTGTCAWGIGYELIQTDRGTESPAEAAPVPPAPAGSVADLAVSLEVPSETGAFTATWRIRSPEGTVFGPELTLSVQVQPQAEPSSAPEGPSNLEAEVSQDGRTVRLTWQDESEDEDAFRVYREDMEASIGLAPANAQTYLDRTVVCGYAYRYSVVAFNAEGTSPVGKVVEVSLPPCALADAPPTITLTVVPTQVVASRVVTISFEALDDLGVVEVEVRGQETGHASLDAGQVFACSGLTCQGSWAVPITQTVVPPEVSATLGVSATLPTSVTWTLVAIVRDTAGQESATLHSLVILPPPE